MYSMCLLNKLLVHYGKTVRHIYRIFVSSHFEEEEHIIRLLFFFSYINHNKILA